LVALAGLAVILPARSAHAASGQCVWEGGPGHPTYAYCKAGDCAGRGGVAECSAGVGAVLGGYTDSQVLLNKWIYSYNNDYTTMPVVAMWCHAAGGTWDASTANPQCLDLPADILGGGGTLTNTEGRAIDVSDAFATLWMGS